MDQRLAWLSFAALLVATACGDDADGDDAHDQGHHTEQDASKSASGLDAGRANSPADMGIVSRGKRIDNLGASCSSDADCKGAGTPRCARDFLGTELKGGYCTATCQLDDECGGEGSCPLAPLVTNPLVGSLLAGFPAECLAKCDPAASNPCREGYQCTAVTGLIPGVQAVAGLLPGAGALVSQPYCVPPISLPSLDGGFALPGLGGNTSLDAGRADAGR